MPYPEDEWFSLNIRCASCQSSTWKMKEEMEERAEWQDILAFTKCCGGGWSETAIPNSEESEFNCVRCGREIDLNKDLIEEGPSKKVLIGILIPTLICSNGHDMPNEERMQ